MIVNMCWVDGFWSSFASPGWGSKQTNMMTRVFVCMSLIESVNFIDYLIAYRYAQTLTAVFLWLWFSAWAFRLEPDNHIKWKKGKRAFIVSLCAMANLSIENRLSFDVCSLRHEWEGREMSLISQSCSDDWKYNDVSSSAGKQRQGFLDGWLSNVQWNLGMLSQ